MPRSLARRQARSKNSLGTEMAVFMTRQPDDQEAPDGDPTRTMPRRDRVNGCRHSRQPLPGRNRAKRPAVGCWRARDQTAGMTMNPPVQAGNHSRALVGSDLMLSGGSRSLRPTRLRRVRAYRLRPGSGRRRGSCPSSTRSRPSLHTRPRPPRGTPRSGRAGAGARLPKRQDSPLPHRTMLLFTGPVGVLRDAPALAWYGSAQGYQEPAPRVA